MKLTETTITEPTVRMRYGFEADDYEDSYVNFDGKFSDLKQTPLQENPQTLPLALRR